MQGSQADSKARPTVEAAGQPNGKQGTKSADVSNSETNVVTALDQPGIGQVQVQPSIQNDATGASATPVADDSALSATERHRVIQGAIANLTKYYVDPDVAQKMSAALVAHESRGDDDAATDGEAFPVTRQMNDVSHDQQIVMLYAELSSLKDRWHRRQKRLRVTEKNWRRITAPSKQSRSCHTISAI